MAKRIKEKAKLRQANKDTRPKAYARHIGISPFKVRRVLDLVRGKSYNDAVAILASLPKVSATPVAKVIKSAAANAEVKGMMAKDLYIAEIYADQGPILKRVMPRGKGSADRILKRTSHITVILDAVSTAEPVNAKEVE